MIVHGTDLFVQDLFVRDQGPRDGVPLVFLHGFPLSSAMWEAQLARFKDRRRVVAYDARGHGRTGGGGAAIAFEWLVDDLLGLLDALGIDRAVVVGLSMGGYTALRFAEREPQRVRGLLLADTKSGADGDAARVKRAAAARQVLAKGLTTFADGFLPTVLSPHTRATRPDLVDRVRAMIEAGDPRDVAAALLALAVRTDTTASLAKIRVPTTVLVGADDALTPPAEARALAAAIPGARLVEIPEAGHFTNLEAPAAFDAALEALLAAV